MGKIEISDLTFAYNDGKREYPVLDKLNLQADAGEFLCLVGKSGCGKSTLLHILAGLLPVNRGMVAIDGRWVEGPGKNRAVVFQHYSLFPWMTVYKNVLFGIQQMRKELGKPAAEEIGERYLRQVEMWEYKDHYPYQLSGGMQQRTAIARALGTDADILLLDEPFGALDPKLRKELQLLLKRLWMEDTLDKTAFFVTHDMEEAVFLGDRVLFMDRGKIRFDVKTSGNREDDRQKLRQLFDRKPGDKDDV